MSYSWPGNIRELENYIEKIVNLGNFPELLETSKNSCPTYDIRVVSKRIRSLDEVEKEAIQCAIEQLNGNISQVAKHLGVGRNTLYTKLKKYNIAL